MLAQAIKDHAIVFLVNKGVVENMRGQSWRQRVQVTIREMINLCWYLRIKNYSGIRMNSA
jgi:hypothetical protein